MRTIILIKNAHLLQLLAFLVECAHLHGELRLRLRQLELLGRDDLDDSVVHLDGAHPLTQTLTRRRVLPHALGRELAVVDVPGTGKVGVITEC